MNPLPTPKEIIQEGLEKGWIRRGPNWIGAPDSWRNAQVDPPGFAPSIKQLSAFSHIQRVVASHFDIDVRWMDFPRRGPERVSVARCVAMLLCLEVTPKPTTTDVAYAFRRERSVLTNCSKCLGKHISESELQQIRQKVFENINQN